MSDEQKMPEVIYTLPDEWSFFDYKIDGSETRDGQVNYLRCDIDPDDAVVVSRNVMDKAKDIINNVNPELTATIATLTAERDARDAKVRELVDCIQARATWMMENEVGPDSHETAIFTLATQLKEQDDE